MKLSRRQLMGAASAATLFPLALCPGTGRPRSQTGALLHAARDHLGPMASQRRSRNRVRFVDDPGALDRPAGQRRREPIARAVGHRGRFVRSARHGGRRLAHIHDARAVDGFSHRHRQQSLHPHGLQRFFRVGKRHIGGSNHRPAFEAALWGKPPPCSGDRAARHGALGPEPLRIPGQTGQLRTFVRRSRLARIHTAPWAHLCTWCAATHGNRTFARLEWTLGSPGR
jgi:hypothetical protein